MFKEVSVAGLNLSAATKFEILNEVESRLRAGQTTYIFTPYSEFLYQALQSKEVMDMLNTADIAIADGIAILWASTFLSLPNKGRAKLVRFLSLLWQVIKSGANILLSPNFVRKVIPEKIVGADFFWDIAELANKNNLSVYLLGGFGNTSLRVAEILLNKFPHLRVVGTSSKNWDDVSVLDDLLVAKPDVLLVAFGPIRQERWIVKHKEALPFVKIALGLGGTFDYVAGTKNAPPKFIRKSGLEWLFRLVTQPSRYKRIYNATFGLVIELVKYKLRHVD